MKQAEIKVGGQYQAKVSGKIVVVRVDAIRETTRFGRDVIVYDVTNLRTGRALTFKSAAKFRRPVSSSFAATVRANNDNTAHVLRSEDRQYVQDSYDHSFRSDNTVPDLPSS